MTVALIVTPGLRDHVEQHVQGDIELRLTLMRGRQLTHMHTIVPPGELFRDTGHTIIATEGEHLVDGVAIEAPGYTLRTWPHDPVVLVGEGWKHAGDTITYTFNLDAP